MRRGVIALVALAALPAVWTAGSFGAETKAGQSQAAPCPVKRPGTYPGAPPAFALPSGGSESVDSARIGIVWSLRRASGTTFARAFCERGRVYRLEYFDEAGRLYFTSDLEYADRSSRSVPSQEGTRALASGVVQATRRGPLRVKATCGTDESAPYDFRWEQPAEWWLNYDSIPSDVDKGLTETNLRNAHAEWENNDNHCNIADASTLDFVYRGRQNLSSVGYDGFSSIDWGQAEVIGGDANTVAVAQSWYSVGTNELLECNIRFDNDNHLFQNIVSGVTPRPGRFDIWHVGAHEVGHCVQFGHVGGETDDSNVMWKYVRVEETTNRRLGKGEANGNNAKY